HVLERDALRCNLEDGRALLVEERDDVLHVLRCRPDDVPSWLVPDGLRIRDLALDLATVDDVRVVRRVADQLVERSGSPQLALDDDRNLVGERLHVGEDVAREEDGPPLLALLEDEIADERTADRIEPERRPTTGRRKNPLR